MYSIFMSDSNISVLKSGLKTRKNLHFVTR